MRTDTRIAPALPGVPPPLPGTCRFCKRTEAQIDGDRISWLGPDRTCCSQYACVRQHWAEVDRAKRLRKGASGRKRTPAEIHEAILAERRNRARRLRAATKGSGR